MTRNVINNKKNSLFLSPKPCWNLNDLLRVENLGYRLHDIPRMQVISMLVLFDGTVIHQILPLQYFEYTFECIFTDVFN